MSVTTDPVLEVRELRKCFGPIDVLHGINLSLERGEVLAIVGDNGAGKSTLIKHIAGVHQPDSGGIRIDNQPVSLGQPLDARYAGIETVFQDLALADDLAVSANIFLGREPIRRILGFFPCVDRKLMRQETAKLLSRIESHIPPRAKSVHSLSGGQRQAVAIARALYWDAKIMVLDEPTAALAVMERENVVRMARSLASQGVGVVYIGHNLIEILGVADRIAVLYHGQVVHVTRADQTNQEELVKYMTGYTEAVT